MSTKDTASLLVRAYTRLGRAFPQEFSQAYGDEVDGLSEEMIRDTAASTGSWLAFLWIMLRVFVDLVVRIAAEYWNELKQDVAYSIRMIRKSPGFACLSILSLGFGIGMCTSTYSQFEGSVFRTVGGVGNPKGLTTIQGMISYPVYEHFRDHSGQFASVAAYLAPVPVVMPTSAGPQRTWGHLVTNNYFSVLDAKPFAGRALGPEDRAGSTATAVISYRLWQNRYGADRGIVGRTLEVNGKPVEIVGVMKEDFLGATPVTATADIWLPLSVQETVAPELANGALTDRLHSVFRIVGRLQPGIRMAQAESALDAQMRQLEKTNGDAGKDRGERRVRLAPGGRALPLRDEDLPLVMTFPLALIGMMLWIVCANVATMLLARSVARRKEIAIRLAVGASRWRMVRQLLTESTMLALAGGLVGIPFAIWSNSTVDQFQPVIPAYATFEFEVSWAALLFTFVVSAGTGILFGLTPALQATRTDLSSALKAGAAQPLKGFRWFSSRNLLVLQQVAGSVALLMLTGLVVLGFQRKSAVDLGYDSRDLWILSVDPIRDGYAPDRAVELLSGLRRRIEAIPGVMSATVTPSAPLGMFSSNATSSQTADPAPGNKFKATSAFRTEPVGQGFFETVAIPIVRGRAFRAGDFAADAPRTAIVNETFANREFARQDPVGKTIEVHGRKHEIIGVAHNVRSGWVVDMPVNGAYVPMDLASFRRPSDGGVQILVRTRPGVDAGREVRQLLATIDPKLALFRISTLEGQLRDVRHIIGIGTALYAMIGVYGLLLAVIGLAGVTAYAVLQRTKEIGIRVALGARRMDVLRLVLSEGVWLAVTGSAAGVVFALGVQKAAGAFLDLLADLTQTSMSDPLLVIGGPIAMLTLTLMACYAPARRALGVEPTSALRED